MAAGPLSRIVLAAASVADDLNYVALADISRVLDAQTTDYRIIGGLMVTALAVRWELGASLYRETGSKRPDTSWSRATGSRDRCLTFPQESPVAFHPPTAPPSTSSCLHTRAGRGRTCE